MSKQCAWLQGYKNKKDKVLVFNESSVSEGRQTFKQIQQIKDVRSWDRNNLHITAEFQRRGESILYGRGQGSFGRASDIWTWQVSKLQQRTTQGRPGLGWLWAGGLAWPGQRMAGEQAGGEILVASTGLRVCLLHGCCSSMFWIRRAI